MQISELLFSPGFSRFSLASSRMLFLFFLCQHKTCKNINILLGKCLLGKAWGYRVPETRSCFLISLLRGLELNELKEHSWHWCFYKTKGSFQQRTSVVQILCTQPGFTLFLNSLGLPNSIFLSTISSPAYSAYRLYWYPDISAHAESPLHRGIWQACAKHSGWKSLWSKKWKQCNAFFSPLLFLSCFVVWIGDL